MMTRTVMVTGSSSGIGRAISEHLLETGHRVVGLARDHDKFRPEENRYVPISVDLSQRKELMDTVQSVLQMHPEIDALVSNAGQGKFGALENFSPQQIESYFQLNLIAHALLSRAIVPHLKTRGGGDILFMGSESALRGAQRGTLYCAAKFALRGLAQSLRAECASRGVRVSLINPGMVRTPFFDDLDFEPGPEETHAIPPEEVARTVSLVLNAAPGTVFDEINLSPLKKVLRSDR